MVILPSRPHREFNYQITVLICHQLIIHILSTRYARLDSCLSQLPVLNNGNLYEWPEPWPERLTSRPPSLSLVGNGDDEDAFGQDTRHWAALLADVYLGGLEINWSGIRNVMDMNAGYGG